MDSEIEKVKREHAIMLAIVAAAINCHGGVPPINSLAIRRDMAHFVNEPEFKPLLICLSEAMEIVRKASYVAIQTQTGDRLEMNSAPNRGENSKRMLSATDAEKLKREHAIMLAMLAAKLNEHEHLPSINDPTYTGWIRRFTEMPESRPLGISLPELGEVFQKALQVALETRNRIGREC